MGDDAGGFLVVVVQPIERLGVAVENIIIALGGGQYFIGVFTKQCGEFF